MKLILELQGYEIHCSTSSSIKSCEKLNVNSSKCKLFNQKLEYDWNEHAFKRCCECLKSEFKGD